MNAQSTARTLPVSWVDRLFDRMQGFYGSLWVDRWRSGELDANGRDRGLLNAKATWCVELGGFVDQSERIQKAIEACRSCKLPPTLPEFMELCRQASPNVVQALPAPKVSPDVARERAAQIQNGAAGLARKSGYDHKKWAKDILANPKAYPSISIKFAKQALGIVDEPGDQDELHKHKEAA